MIRHVTCSLVKNRNIGKTNLNGVIFICFFNDVLWCFVHVWPSWTFGNSWKGLAVLLKRKSNVLAKSWNDQKISGKFREDFVTVPAEDLVEFIGRPLEMGPPSYHPHWLKNSIVSPIITWFTSGKGIWLLLVWVHSIGVLHDRRRKWAWFCSWCVRCRSNHVKPLGC